MAVKSLGLDCTLPRHQSRLLLCLHCNCCSLHSTRNKQITVASQLRAKLFLITLELWCWPQYRHASVKLHKNYPKHMTFTTISHNYIYLNITNFHSMFMHLSGKINICVFPNKMPSPSSHKKERVFKTKYP